MIYQHLKGHNRNYLPDWAVVYKITDDKMIARGTDEVVKFNWANSYNNVNKNFGIENKYKDVLTWLMLSMKSKKQ